MRKNAKIKKSQYLILNKINRIKKPQSDNTIKNIIFILNKKQITKKFGDEI